MKMGRRSDHTRPYRLRDLDRIADEEIATGLPPQGRLSRCYRATAGDEAIAFFIAHHPSVVLLLPKTLIVSERLSQNTIASRSLTESMQHCAKIVRVEPVFFMEMRQPIYG